MTPPKIGTTFLSGLTCPVRRALAFTDFLAMRFTQVVITIPMGGLLPVGVS